MDIEKAAEVLLRAICDYRFPAAVAIDHAVIGHLTREAEAYAKALAAALPLLTGGQWQNISTAPKDRPICVARLGGHRDDGTAYFYRAIGHYSSLADGFFHISHGTLYGDPELWAPYPSDPVAILAEERGTK